MKNLPSCWKSPVVALIAALCSITVGQGAEPPAPSNSSLQPFFPSGPAKADAQNGKALAGIWKGVFTSKNSDGSMAETIYGVEVSNALDSVKVSVSPSVQAPVPTQGINRFLNAVTTQPALCSPFVNGTLPAKAVDVLVEGKTKTEVEKRYTLQPGRDNRHLRFACEITVKSVEGKTTTSGTYRCEGVLTRSR